MNKKFFISWAVIFIVWMCGSFVVHGLWLGDTYAAMGNIMRPEAEQQELFPFMLLAHVLLAGAFVWIYQRGIDDSPWVGQGIRYGLAIAVLAPIPTYMIYYTVQQSPGSLAVNQALGDGILLLVLGIVVAFLNKPAASAG
jgi:hypothetical protein